jgi:tetratricopeptide (TPR) repeat protein
LDSDTADLFTLQSEITSQIANALGVELIAAEAAGASPHPDALDYILLGRAEWNMGPTRDNYAQAISLFERALALDPRSVDAHSWLASALATRVTSQLTDSAEADIARAEGLIGKVLAASPRSPLAHYAKGQALRARGRYKEAIPEYEAALALNRNLVGALNGLGWCNLFAGSIDEVIPLQDQAIRLSPRDPRVGWWYFLIGTVYLLQSRADDAILWLEKARSHIPAHSTIRADLASAYALNGEIERATAELTEARGLSSDDRYSSLARLRARRVHLVPEIRALFEATYDIGLRKAGMPEG